MKNHVVILLSILLLNACASNSVKIKPNQLPTNLVKQGIKKSDVEVVLYIPKWNLEYAYTNQVGIKTNFGQSLKQAFADVGQVLMSNVEIVDSKQSNKAGLFMALHPSWSAKDGVLTLTTAYSVYDGNYDLVLEGTATHAEEHLYNYTDTLYYNIAVRTAQKAYIDVNKMLKPSADIYPAMNTLENINANKLVNLNKPYHQLSAIALNDEGYLLTSNSNLQACMILEAVVDQQKIDIQYLAKSDLLNISLFKAAKPFKNHVTIGDIKQNKLGAPLVAVSYSFKESASTVMSFANLASNSGVQGSFKSHLVSSAIAPASTLAGFYDENGYLVGLFSDYLNYKWMLKRETIQPNTYQMMEIAPVLKFLDKNQVKYSQFFSDAQTHVGLEEATNNLVQINCYQ